MSFRILASAAMGLATLFPALVTAQDIVGPMINGRTGVFVTGRILDRTDGRDLGAAHVVFAEPGPEGAVVWEGLSRSNGQFEIDNLPFGAYEIRVSLLAYTTLVHQADLSESYTMDFRIEMSPGAVALEPLVVTARRRTRLEMSGFYERRAIGSGTTLTREEIEGRNPNRVSDLFYGIAGTRVVSPTRPGQSRQVFLRGGCVPQLVLDGAPFGMPIPIDEVVSPHELEAIEVYQGSSSPVRYSTSTCGTIIAWTREASSEEGSPLTLKRFLGATGVVALFFLVFN